MCFASQHPHSTTDCSGCDCRVHAASKPGQKKLALKKRVAMDCTLHSPSTCPSPALTYQRAVVLFLEINLKMHLDFLIISCTQYQDVGTSRTPGSLHPHLLVAQAQADCNPRIVVPLFLPHCSKMRWSVWCLCLSFCRACLTCGGLYAVVCVRPRVQRILHTFPCSISSLLCAIS